MAYHLAHQPMNDYEPMKFDFPDEEIMYIRDCNIPDPDEGPVNVKKTNQTMKAFKSDLSLR